jgi:hypothetical protein
LLEPLPAALGAVEVDDLEPVRPRVNERLPTLRIERAPGDFAQLKCSTYSLRARRRERSPKAVLMRWNTVPTKLQRELFDCASTIGDLQQTTPLKGQIARFLHNHKNDEQKSG